MSYEFNFEIDPFRALAEYGGAFELRGFESAAGWQGEVNRGTPAYVTWVQQSLNQLLGLRLAVDGQLGPQTRSAIRSFQQKQGLTADGVVGPKTEAALVAAGAPPPPGTSTPAPPQTGVIDPRIDVHAQRSLQRLLTSERPGFAGLARGLLGAVRGEDGLAGIYIENQQVPAQFARKLNMGWWQLIPKGADAAVAFNLASPSPSALVLFRDRLRNDPARLDTALLKAWSTFQQAQKLPAELKRAAQEEAARSRPVAEAEAESFSLSSLVPLIVPILSLPTLPVRPLAASEIAVAGPVFGASLNYGLIFVSSALGLGGAPFTLYVAAPGFTVLNMGPGPFSSPASKPALLIHELVHSWQSQHHPVPWQYEVNSVASQAGAAMFKRLSGKDADAYCYRPGRSFAVYAAEQIAESVENGFLGTGGTHSSTITSHINSMPPVLPSPLNVASLAFPRWEIRGAAGVTC